MNNINSNKISYDTTEALWDRLYKVRIPYQIARSEEDIRMFGTVVTGIKDIDNTIHSELIVTMKCIADLADMYRDGVPIGICNYDDTFKIYQAIQDHLYAWRAHLGNAVNIGESPMDDLVILDEFANAVYGFAKHQGADKLSNSLIVRQLGFENKATTMNFFKQESLEKILNGKTKEGTVTINKIKESNTEKERESLADFFKHAKNNI